MRVSAPILGRGVMVSVGDDTREGDTAWSEREVDLLLASEHQAPWTRCVDAVKRLYPGAVLKSLSPFVMVHPELGRETLTDFPWQMLPR